MVVNRVLASRFGRAFEALRDSPDRLRLHGRERVPHKVLAFVVARPWPGSAASLFAYSEQYIAPNTFAFDLSVQFLLAVTMGGRKSRVGPILGAAIVVLLPNLLADIALFRDGGGRHRGRRSGWPGSRSRRAGATRCGWRRCRSACASRSSSSRCC